MNDYFDKDDYVAYRLEKADETLQVAALLIENEMWNSAINRLYYACFYAVTALLVHIDVQAKSHSGVRTMFFAEFFKTKKFDKELGILYADLFDWREKGDYGDFFDFQGKTVQPLLMKCTKFIQRIKNEIYEYPKE